MRLKPTALWLAGAMLIALLAGCGATSATSGSTTTVGPATTTPPASVAGPTHGSPLRFTSPQTVSHGSGLASVSCGSATLCVALDASGRGYSFNGSMWSAPVPPTGQSLGPGALSVSCAGPTLCMAVATAGSQIASWNGQGWSTPATVEGADGLEAVGCAPTAYCASVDASGNAFAFDGQSWRGTSGDWGSVSSISCVSSTFCVSVSGGISLWGGQQWTQPNPYSSTSNFSGVSCPTSSFCTAVDAGGQVLQWNGQTWSASTSIEPAPATATASSISLTGVSCPTTSYCAAVDSSGGVVQWSNGAWVRADVDGGRKLTAISCPTTTLCVAVDGAGNVLLGRPDRGT